MNAARRVKSPSVTSTLVTSSITPAIHRKLPTSCNPGFPPGGKPNSLMSACSRKSSPTTIRRMASSCGCHRESQGSSIALLPYWLRRLTGRVRRPPEGSRVFLLLRRRRMRRIFGECSARAVDHVDPVVERMRELGDELLQGSVLEAAALIEAVVADVAEIGFGLLHHRHVEEHAGLADLVVRAEAADRPGRGSDNCGRFLVEDALA